MAGSRVYIAQLVLLDVKPIQSIRLQRLSVTTHYCRINCRSAGARSTVAAAAASGAVRATVIDVESLVGSRRALSPARLPAHTDRLDEPRIVRNACNDFQSQTESH